LCWFREGLLEFSECTPAVTGAHVHGDGELALVPGRAVDGGTGLGDRLISAERVVADQVHEPAVVELYERLRVEFLQPAADFGQVADGP
jgi:hypothetical protein